jgi:hypothetical protein
MEEIMEFIEELIQANGEKGEGFIQRSPFTGKY